MTTIYRADQVGSLIRPASLLAARQAYAEKRISRDVLRVEEERAIGDELFLRCRVDEQQVFLTIVVAAEVGRGSGHVESAESRS